MSPILFKGNPVNINDDIVIDDVIVRVTDQLIHSNRKLFRLLSDIAFVKCIRWQGNIFTVGEIYRVVNEKIYNNANNPNWVELSSFSNSFEESSQPEFNSQAHHLNDELMKTAKEKFSIGTKFLATSTQTKGLSTIKEDTVFYWNSGKTVITTSLYPGDIYKKETNEWAEIMPEYIKIKDDVEQKTGRWAAREPGKIYKVLDFKIADGCDQPCYYVSKTTSILPSDCDICTKEEYELALSSTMPENNIVLFDYEGKLLLDDDEVDADLNTNKWEIYYWLKSNEPRLYWSKVLEVIASALNEGWVPNWNDCDELKYKIILLDNQFKVCSNNAINHGSTFFKSKDAAQKAIEILGDKLKYLYL
jgi:hypothetical protein